MEKLSDVVDTMNVSYSATIKKGTVEISGNSATLDETNFKSADLNAIVSVRVINQTTSAQTGCEFRGLRGYIPGTARFNEVYGDCYISGEESHRLVDYKRANTRCRVHGRWRFYRNDIDQGFGSKQRKGSDQPVS